MNKLTVQEDWSAYIKTLAFGHSFCHLCFILAEYRPNFCTKYRLHLDFLWLLFQGILQEALTKTFTAITNCLTKSNGLVVYQE